ncbi:MAG TPA: 3'-5' exonuclease [Anaerolineales bacterium]|jgi:DNA polymerase III epsilon subunit-like protein|nr:3'-5' exonuclease [Anaerolineales bacterium]
MAAPIETFISVDVESAGPYPARYSLLSIGACLVSDPEQGFYIELKPVNREKVESAVHVSHLSLDDLQKTGVEPAKAMQQFIDWLNQVAPSSSSRPIMVGFNASYDWSFIDHYFQKYTGDNPFGHGAIDIKAFYMGMIGCAWEETSMIYLSPRFLKGQQLPHNALADARLQADLFRTLLAQARGEKVKGR